MDLYHDKFILLSMNKKSGLLGLVIIIENNITQYMKGVTLYEKRERIDVL